MKPIRFIFTKEEAGKKYVQNAQIFFFFFFFNAADPTPEKLFPRDQFNWSHFQTFSTCQENKRNTNCSVYLKGCMFLQTHLSTNQESVIVQKEKKKRIGLTSKTGTVSRTAFTLQVENKTSVLGWLIRAATVLQPRQTTDCDMIPHHLVFMRARRNKFHLSIQTIRSKYSQWNKAFVHVLTNQHSSYHTENGSTPRVQIPLTESGFKVLGFFFTAMSQHDAWELYNLLLGPSGILHVNIPITLEWSQPH